MFRLPVWAMPGLMGLKGKSREVAVAEYLFTGEKLARQLNIIEHDHVDTSKTFLLQEKQINLDFDLISEHDFKVKENVIRNDKDSNEFKLTNLQLDLDIGLISNEAFKRGTVEVTYEKDTTDYTKAMLDVDFEFEIITKNEYDKGIATTDAEPWVSAVLHADEETGQYYFDCDWNDLFIAELRSKNYTGVTDEDVMDQWLSRLYATEIYDEVVIGEGSGAQRVETSDGKAEYK